MLYGPNTMVWNTSGQWYTHRLCFCIPAPQLRTSGKREANPTIWYNNGNIHHRGQYKDASALPTCYMDLMEWFGALLDDDTPTVHASVCHHPTLTRLGITSRTTFSVYQKLYMDKHAIKCVSKIIHIPNVENNGSSNSFEPPLTTLYLQVWGKYGQNQ